MKKLFLGAIATCCMLDAGAGAGAGAGAANVDDFIGTWKLERTTIPNYVVIKQEGEALVALHYTRNITTNKIVERRFPASYAAGEVTIASGATPIAARSVDDVATVKVLGEAYQKISSSTAAPQS